MAGIDSVTCDSWEQYKSQVIGELFDDNLYRREAYVFRGHRSSEWELQSSFDRWFSTFGDADRVKTFEALRATFLKELEGEDIPDSVRTDDVAVLALAQHYGMPTRLLDWSESPYVAAWFAFSEAISSGDTDGNVAVWALSMQSNVWSKETGVEVLRVPSIGNIRLRNQAGKFTLSRTPFRCLEEYVEHCVGHEAALIQFMIPVAEARCALADLDAMGISHSRIFPGIAGCALSAKMRVMLDRGVPG